MCFHTRSSDSFIQCCLSVWSSVVSHVFTSELQYVVISIQMCLYNKRFLSTGISLAHLKSWRRPAAAVLLSANLIPALYTGLIHQRGTLDVMNHLQPLCDVGNVSTTRPQPDVFFLMPCHSTPFYRYLMCFNRFPNHCIQLFSFHTASQVFKIWDCLNLIFKIYSLKIRVFKIKHWKHVLIMYLLWYERLIHINVLSCPLSVFRAHFLDHIMMLCSWWSCLLTATSTARLRWDFSSVLQIWERKLTWMKLRDFTRSLFSGSGPHSHTSPLCPPIWSCLMFWKR